MEKKKASYDLAAIKAAFATVATLRMRDTAQKSAIALGFSTKEIVDIIQSIKGAMFYKSMTTYADATVWQDVYRVPSTGGLLYVKFQKDSDGLFVIQFKEN